MTNKQLAQFLAHSVELESQAQERYLELAESMAAHHNDRVADFFKRMAGEADLHLAEVSKLAEGRRLPHLNAWEFDWPEAEPPETSSYEAVHYRMSLGQAIRLFPEPAFSATMVMASASAMTTAGSRGYCQ